MNNKYSISHHIRVYDEDNGVFTEIRPDMDGLGCLAVYCFNKGNQIDESITFPPEQAILIANAMIEIANKMIKDEKTN